MKTNNPVIAGPGIGDTTGVGEILFQIKATSVLNPVKPLLSGLGLFSVAS